MHCLMGVADAAAADREQAGQGLLVTEPPWESAVARIWSASVIFAGRFRRGLRAAGRGRGGRVVDGGRVGYRDPAGHGLEGWRLMPSGWDGTRRCQPVSQPAEFTGGLPVGVVMQRLQGHRRGYLRGRDRRPGPPPEGRTGPHNRHPERLRPGARPGTRTCCPPEPLPSQSAASRNCRPARLEPCMRNHLRPSNTKPAKGHHLAAFSARS
jgi:hypothetical protein